MQFVTDWELKGREQGIQEGLQQGLLQGRQEGQITKGREDILRILEIRFEEISQDLRETIGQIEDLEVLGTLLVQAVTTQSLEAFASAASEGLESENPESSEDTDNQSDRT
ncbi:MAG: hypothetical protein SWY16_03795 [Cyanobacteriota bacterium]|nr:hypothetical protein [Cyanobacteriota bacterium]